MRVLIIEDSLTLLESLRTGLSREGFAVDIASDGEHGLSLSRNNPYDVLVLDLMLPRVDGLAILEQLRENEDRPHVLVLTARDRVEDRVDTLNRGADDYLVKPFAIEELLARTRALLRRHGEEPTTATLDLADLQLDLDGRTASRNGTPIELTKTEFNLLELLIRNTGVVMQRDQLYEDIWGYEFTTDSKTLDVYIGYLRKKTEIDGASRLIHTVRGVGYVARIE